MKALNSVLFFLVLVQLPAQDFIRVTPTEYKGFGAVAAPTYQVEVDRVERKDFMDHWEKYLEDETDLKVERNDNEILLKQMVLKATGSKVLNIYMHFEDMEGGTRAYVAFQDTVSGFINPSDPDYGLALKKLIYDETSIVFVQTKAKDLDKERDYLEKLEDDYHDAVKNQDKLRKKVLDKQQDIDKAQNDIKINEGVLNETNDDVANRRSELNSLTASTPEEVRERAEKELKTSEKKRDKLRKSIDKDKKKTYELENDIRDLNYLIEKANTDIEYAKEKVEEQRQIVLKLQDVVYELERK